MTSNEEIFNEICKAEKIEIIKELGKGGFGLVKEVKLKGISYDECVRATTENAKRFFGF